MESVPYRMLQFLFRRCGMALSLWSVLVLAAASQVVEASTPTPVETIYVIPSSHWDLGFVHPPDAVREAMKPHLDAVIAACEADPQFRWTIESVWQLDAWLERTRDPAQIKRMTDLLHSGQIELSAAYGSMHTEFMGDEELNRLISDGSRIEQRFRVHPKVAMMNDVPGFSIRVPQILVRSGVRYVITGSNTALGGGAKLWPGKVPFYWESQDGSKVLTWQTQGKNGGYTEGLADYYLAPQMKDPYLHTPFYPKEWKGLSDLEIMQRGIDKLLKQYSDAGYRHRSLAVLFMHDAIGPEYELKGLLPNVRAWNAAGKLPHIVVATPSEYFAYLETHGAQDAPVYKGDWSGLWAEVKLNSPAMSADARALQGLLPQTETLWSLLKMKGLTAEYPEKEIASAYRSLFTYDEHNGAGQGGWPGLMKYEEVLEQNREYSDGLRAGRASAAALLDSGLSKLASAESGRKDARRTLLVYNTQSWARTLLVNVPNLQGAWRVRDAGTGAVIRSQQLSSGELCFEARNVPSIGFRTYWLEPVAKKATDSVAADSAVLESPYFRVELNPTTGAVTRITDLRAHRVIVDEKDGGHAGDLVLNSAVYDGLSDANHVELHREKGAIVDWVVISRPGTLWPQTIISLPQSKPAVYLQEVLDRSKMRVVENKKPRDLYSFAFDFSLQGKAQRWIDDGEGIYRFPEDLLPGARNDAAVPRHTLVWSDGAGGSSYHVMLAQKQAFFDRFRDKSSASTESGHSLDGVFADVMIKTDHAETRDRGVVSFATYEPGYPTTYNFLFALTGGAGAENAIAAHRFGVQTEADFVELSADHSPGGSMASLISVSAPNVIVEALRPSSDGKPEDFLLRLQEIAGKPAEFHLKLPLPLHSIAETSMTEDRVLQPTVQANAIHIAPYQTLTLRLSMQRPAAASSGVEK